MGIIEAIAVGIEQYGIKIYDFLLDSEDQEKDGW
jgi:hypothetical protein